MKCGGSTTHVEIENPSSSMGILLRNRKDIAVAHETWFITRLTNQSPFEQSLRWFVTCSIYHPDDRDRDRPFLSLGELSSGDVEFVARNARVCDLRCSVQFLLLQLPTIHKQTNQSWIMGPRSPPRPGRHRFRFRPLSSVSVLLVTAKVTEQAAAAVLPGMRRIAHGRKGKCCMWLVEKVKNHFAIIGFLNSKSSSLNTQWS